MFPSSATHCGRPPRVGIFGLCTAQFFALRSFFPPFLFPLVLALVSQSLHMDVSRNSFDRLAQDTDVSMVSSHELLAMLRRSSWVGASAHHGPTSVDAVRVLVDPVVFGRPFHRQVLCVLVGAWKPDAPARP